MTGLRPSTPPQRSKSRTEARSGIIKYSTVALYNSLNATDPAAHIAGVTAQKRAATQVETAVRNSLAKVHRNLPKVPAMASPPTMHKPASEQR